MSQSSPVRTLRILGIRGLPAAHGGFETFAQHLALYLVRRGWRVIVYCQADGAHVASESTWQGVELITIPIATTGAKGSMLFDWKCIRHAARFGDLCLTLGYNTATFCAWLRLKGVPNLINMDGVEWRRAKWGKAAKAWFWLNDWMGCWLADHLIADHPEIARHLRSRVSTQKITTIGYGARRVVNPDVEPLRQFNLSPGRYFIVVARAEPENSVLEIVKAFSRQRRGVQLVIVGHLDPDHYHYHASIKAAASAEVQFLGPIYDQPLLEALRYHTLAYLHGHQVGGTNPSLVEALGAGNAVIAHDNQYNRWVAGSGARYFKSTEELSAIVDDTLKNPQCLEQMRASSVVRFNAGFSWEGILFQYLGLLESWLPRRKNTFPSLVARTAKTVDSVVRDTQLLGAPSGERD